MILDITQKNLKLKAKDLIAFDKTKLQNFLTKSLLLNFMEDKKKKVAKPTKKDLQKKVKVVSKDNFKNTLDAFLKVNINEIKKK